MIKNNKILYFIILILFSVIVGGTIISKNNSASKKFEINILSKQLQIKNQQLAKIQKKLSARDLNLQNIVSNGNISFKKLISDQKIDNKFIFSKFQTEDILFSKNNSALGSSYIEYYDNNLYLASGNGIFAFNKFENEIKDLKIINTNIKEIVKYDKFYETSQYGIKDLFIHDKKIYVSLINEKFENCFDLSILRADLNKELLKFNFFFKAKKCIKVDNEYGEFWAHQGAGGRMVLYKNESILFSTGDFRYRTLAQDKNSDYGKILKINLVDGKSEVLSMGHRNAQGLYFNEKYNYIISTEHGPKGGDEININRNPETKIKNFGWPISSYGNHYKKNYSKQRLEGAPLHKSHSKFGFEEPLKYYAASIGISEIVSINDRNDEHEFLVGAMGSEIKEGDLSIHYIKLNKSKSKVIEHNIVTIGERIRDMVYLKNKNIVLLFLETSSSIGILKII